MRSWLSVIVVATVLVLSACSVVTGSGRIESETREVSGFTRIDLSGSGEVTVVQGDVESLTVEADDNVLPVLTSDVSDSTLKLGTKSGTTVNTRSPIRYRVMIKDFTGISLSGSGSVIADDVQVGALRSDISGSGSVELGGSADEQDIRVSGSGRYEAAGLTSEKVNAEISGSGRVVVTVSGELKVDISGSGTVTYSGDPTVDESISGSGRLIKK